MHSVPRSVSHPSYTEVHTFACVTIANEIQKRQLDIQMIVGIARGGLIPAVAVSHLLGIPMRAAYHHSIDGAGDDYGLDGYTCFPSLNEKRILIIDDICDSGCTLQESRDHYTKQNHVVFTAVIHYKSSSKFVPDIYHWKIPEDAPWIVYPWEEEL